MPTSLLQNLPTPVPLAALTDNASTFPKLLHCSLYRPFGSLQFFNYFIYRYCGIRRNQPDNFFFQTATQTAIMSIWNTVFRDKRTLQGREEDTQAVPDHLVCWLLCAKVTAGIADLLYAAPPRFDIACPVENIGYVGIVRDGLVRFQQGFR